MIIFLVIAGVDPKSVLCAFFKQGNCGKGAKCKFSHDLNIARKAEKRNIYETDKKGEYRLQGSKKQIIRLSETSKNCGG